MKELLSAASLHHLMVPRRVPGSWHPPNHQLLVDSAFSSADDDDDHSPRCCLFVPNGTCSITTGDQRALYRVRDPPR